MGHRRGVVNSSPGAGSTHRLNRGKNVDIQNEDKPHSPYVFVYGTRDEADADQHFTREFSPLSGSEPTYNPSRWNDNADIKYSHNCYAYSINKYAGAMRYKAQPGYSSMYDGGLRGKDFTCQNFLRRLKKDNPGLYVTTFEKPCRKGFHKIFLTLATDETNRDYHFARQDSNGYWSHKPGSTKVTNRDASGNLIKNPMQANWKYNINYDKNCFFMCVNPATSHVSSSVASVAKVPLMPVVEQVVGGGGRRSKHSSLRVRKHRSCRRQG